MSETYYAFDKYSGILKFKGTLCECKESIYSTNCDLVFLTKAEAKSQGFSTN